MTVDSGKWTVMEQTVERKSFLFAVRIVKLSKHLNANKKEYVLSKQLLRSGTSIGANIAEAEQAQSRALRTCTGRKQATSTYGKV